MTLLLFSGTGLGHSGGGGGWDYIGPVESIDAAVRVVPLLPGLAGDWAQVFDTEAEAIVAEWLYAKPPEFPEGPGWQRMPEDPEWDILGWAPGYDPRWRAKSALHPGRYPHETGSAQHP